MTIKKGGLDSFASLYRSAKSPTILVRVFGLASLKCQEYANYGCFIRIVTRKQRCECQPTAEALKR